MSASVYVTVAVCQRVRELMYVRKSVYSAEAFLEIDDAEEVDIERRIDEIRRRRREGGRGVIIRQKWSYCENQRSKVIC